MTCDVKGCAKQHTHIVTALEISSIASQRLVMRTYLYFCVSCYDEIYVHEHLKAREEFWNLGF